MSPIQFRSAKNSLLVLPLFALLLVTLLLVGCDSSSSNHSPAADSPAAIVDATETPITSMIPAAINTETSFSIGPLRGIEVAGVLLTSLPDTTSNVTTASQELGRLLFWDPILSGDMDIACATCHLPEFGYTDGRSRSIGTGGVGAGPSRVAGQSDLTRRNAPTLLNTLWSGIDESGTFNQDTAPMFWDNRTQSLAAQALNPIHSQLEMRGTNFSGDEIDSEIINRLTNNSEYQQRFEQSFGSDTITSTLIGQALADFQSTLIANNSPFDQWVRGDANAMNQQQLDGMLVFAETGCADCHSGPMFSDFETHVLGVDEAEGLDAPDMGAGDFAFRTPTLRQLTFTAPYFHGGQENTLADVMDFYERPGSENPNIRRNQLAPDFLAQPSLNSRQSDAIGVFLGALNDTNFDRTRPESVPSGLPVGGAL